MSGQMHSLGCAVCTEEGSTASLEGLQYSLNHILWYPILIIIIIILLRISSYEQALQSST